MPSKTPFRDFCVVTNADVIFALLSALTFQAALQLTSGRFEVSDVRLSSDKTKFYFTSSEGSLFQRHLYSMALAGGRVE